MSSRSLAQTWHYPFQRDFERELQETAASWFKAHNYATHSRYPYILADRERWQENIILPQVAAYVAQIKQEREKDKKIFPLHKYVHHGLSSQAMLFNLVGPLIVRNDFAPLADAFEKAGIPFPAGTVSVELEIEDRRVFNEDAGQPTSIDLVIRSAADAPALFIESKLVEKEFGGCSVFQNGDCDGQNPKDDLGQCFLHHTGKLYWKKLDALGFMNGRFAASPICPLANYYQYFREVMFALDKRGYFVLLADERNPVFHRTGKAGERGLMPFLLQFVPPQHREFVRMITIQSVVQAIEHTGRHTDWIGEFKSKYGIS